MSPRRLPEIPKAALRDYAGSEPTRSIWRRLELDLRPSRRTERRSPLLWAWAWAPAFAVTLFGSGVFVGSRFLRPQALPFVQAEPQARAAPAAAALIPKNAIEPELPEPVKATPTRLRRVPSAGASIAEPLGYGIVAESPRPTQAPAAAEWQHFLEQGDFAAARRALDRQGGFDVAIAHASPSELMSLVDIARASGERNQATSALRQVLAHPDAPEAPLAAWTLGNLLDQAGDAPGAAQAFALYRRLSPTGDFAEDAAARQIDVALAEGNADLVRQLLEDYARDFPHGRRLSEFQRAESVLVNRDRDAGPKSDVVHDEPDDDPDESHAESATPAPTSSEAH